MTERPVENFPAIRLSGYSEYEPLLKWATQSRVFSSYVAGSPVCFFRCPNSRKKPGLDASLVELAERIQADKQPTTPVIVVDHSNEGPELIPHYFETLHRFARDTDLPLGNLIYASQNRLAPRSRNLPSKAWVRPAVIAG